MWGGAEGPRGGGGGLLVEPRKDQLMEHEMKSSVFAGWEEPATHGIRKAKLTPVLHARPHKRKYLEGDLPVQKSS